MEKTYYLPAEWHPQSYIQLTWPHAETDWAYMLDEVEACFYDIARESPHDSLCCSWHRTFQKNWKTLRSATI